MTGPFPAAWRGGGWVLCGWVGVGLLAYDGDLPFDVADVAVEGVDALLHGVESSVDGVEPLVDGVEALVHGVEARVHDGSEVGDAPVDAVFDLVDAELDLVAEVAASAAGVDHEGDEAGGDDADECPGGSH